MALNKAADADTVYWSLAGCTRVPRPGMSGGTVAGRGEPANRCWGARGYADLTTIFGSCRGANQQIVGAARRTDQAFRCAAVTRREATGAIWWIRATHLAGGP